MGGTEAQKLQKENNKQKQKNKDRESRAFLQNDMIMIWETVFVLKSSI